MKKYLYAFTLSLFVVLPSQAQFFVGYGNGISIPNEDIISDFIDGNSLQYRFSTGYKGDSFGSSFAFTVLSEKGLQNIWNLSLDFYPTSNFITQLGISVTSINDGDFLVENNEVEVRAFKNKSIGIFLGLSYEQKITNQFNIGINLNHEIHGINSISLDKYLNIGGTSLIAYGKFYLSQN